MDEEEVVLLVVNRENGEMAIIDTQTYYQTKKEHVFIFIEGEIFALPREKYTVLQSFIPYDENILPLKTAENVGDVPKSLTNEEIIDINMQNNT